jgi:hypothetical protein
MVLRRGEVAVLATSSPTVLHELALAQLADDRRAERHLLDVQEARRAERPARVEKREPRVTPSWWPPAGLRWHAG